MARIVRTTKLPTDCPCGKEEIIQHGDGSGSCTGSGCKPTFIFMYQVTSSNVAFVGHDGIDKMYVTYKNDTMYVFDEINKVYFHANILKSESVGKAILAIGRKGTKL